jgi:hypothetical protein
MTAPPDAGLHMPQRWRAYTVVSAAITSGNSEVSRSEIANLELAIPSMEALQPSLAEVPAFAGSPTGANVLVALIDCPAFTMGELDYYGNAMELNLPRGGNGGAKF